MSPEETAKRGKGETEQHSRLSLEDQRTLMRSLLVATATEEKEMGESECERDKECLKFDWIKSYASEAATNTQESKQRSKLVSVKSSRDPKPTTKKT